jgi:hypothetical protein
MLLDFKQYAVTPSKEIIWPALPPFKVALFMIVCTSSWASKNCEFSAFAFENWYKKSCTRRK